MSIEHHLQDLRMVLKHTEEGKPGNWLGHWAKSLKVKKMREKIRELEKQLNKQK
jgi:hypothetical protein